MTGGKVYVAPVGADPKDPSRWHQVGTLTEMEMRQDDGWLGGGHTNTLTTRGPVTLFKPEPVKARMSYEFTFNTKPHSLDALSLYYGTDVKPAGIVNNRGGTRKEEKHMGIRKFESSSGDTRLRIDNDRVGRTAGSTGAYVKMFDDDGADAYGWFEKADVPLIAHALFEKSGWPGAVKDSVGDWGVGTPSGDTGWGFGVRDERSADKALAEAIANLAAYNAWHEGAAEREAAEAAKEAEAEAARKREHDELRTSAIALEALELYNENYAENQCAPYASWDDVNSGGGAKDESVRYWIAKAEAARAAKPAPKLGDRVRVPADAKTASGGPVCFGGEVEGVIERLAGDNIDIKASTPIYPTGLKQWVDIKYVTVVATAEELAAEKLKAERDAGIAAIQEAADPVALVSRYTAEHLYDRGIRAAA